jgi:hypothetical protein
MYKSTFYRCVNRLPTGTQADSLRVRKPTPYRCANQLPMRLTTHFGTTWCVTCQDLWSTSTPLATKFWPLMNRHLEQSTWQSTDHDPFSKNPALGSCGGGAPRSSSWGVHQETVSSLHRRSIFSLSHLLDRRVSFEAANMEAVVIGQLRYCTGKSHSVVLGGHSTIRTPPSSLFLPPRMRRASRREQPV